MAPAVVSRNASSCILVTAGNRGLGLEHVKQFLQKTEVKVVATARQPGQADELNGLLQEYPKRLTTVQLDTSDEASIEAAAKQVEQLHPGGIDLIINNAGMQEQICRGIAASGEDYKRVLEVNVVGPFLVTKHFLPQLQKKKTRVVVNLSSGCGSISANAAGRFKGLMLPYNSSKAAINMQTAVLANDLKDEGFTFIALHPGWVSTDMGKLSGPFLGGEPPLDPPTSIKGQHEVIFGLTHDQNGQYLNWKGDKLEY